MRRALLIALACAVALTPAAPAMAGEGESDGPPSLRDRVEELQQELDSLTEEVEDLEEPMEEFELFDQCMYAIGVTEHGAADGAFGYEFDGRAGSARRPALALDIGGFGRPMFHFLAFPGEEPPSLECNEDTANESIED